jgi:hypothetical protein
MKSFKLYFEEYVLLTEAASKPGHIDHLEELVLLRGQEGYDQARTALSNLLSHLQGKSKRKINTSVKWDGAPAIFAGKHPVNGKFFVATKSIFNSEPKINYTEQDINNNHGNAPGLQDKLKQALNILPKLGMGNNVLWGDYMFWKELVGEPEDIDGVPHYTFKPNTIKYAVEVDSELGRQIADKISDDGVGIVFHTQFHGKPEEFPKALDIDPVTGKKEQHSKKWGPMAGGIVKKFKDVPGLWVDDAYFKELTGQVSLTEDEAKQIKDIIKTADTLQVNYNDLPLDFIKIYLNTELKREKDGVPTPEFIKDPEKSYRYFIEWYSEREQKKWKSPEEIKTAAQANAQQQKEDNLQLKINEFESQKDNFINLFKVSSLLAQAKQIFINKYDNAVYNTKHFLDEGDGVLKVTNPEGYVAVSNAGDAGPVKLVNRLDFSAANFATGKPGS